MRLTVRTVLLLAALAVVVATALVLALVVVPRGLVLEGERGLPEGRSLLVKTRVEGLIHRGDAFPYFVEVLYDPSQIAEIDKTSLDQTIDFQPFEVRQMTESDFGLDSRTRVYRRRYELQLVDGQAGVLYTFPSVTVRFRLRDSGAMSERAGTPVPVLVSPILPADVTGLELRPVKGTVATASRMHLPWVLWGLAAALAIVGVVDLVGRAIPNWRQRTAQQLMAETRTLAVAYRSLWENRQQGVEARRLFYQMEHILRVVLARKGQGQWLGEPDANAVPAEIRPTVLSLLQRCQAGYSPNGVEHRDVDQAFSQLEDILRFYWREEVVEAWRSSPTS